MEKKQKNNSIKYIFGSIAFILLLVPTMLLLVLSYWNNSQIQDLSRHFAGFVASLDQYKLRTLSETEYVFETIADIVAQGCHDQCNSIYTPGYEESMSVETQYDIKIRTKAQKTLSVHNAKYDVYFRDAISQKLDEIGFIERSENYWVNDNIEPRPARVADKFEKIAIQINVTDGHLDFPGYFSVSIYFMGSINNEAYRILGGVNAFLDHLSEPEKSKYKSETYSYEHETYIYYPAQYADITYGEYTGILQLGVTGSELPNDFPASGVADYYDNPNLFNFVYLYRKYGPQQETYEYAGTSLGAMSCDEIDQLPKAELYKGISCFREGQLSNY